MSKKFGKMPADLYDCYVLSIKKSDQHLREFFKFPQASKVVSRRKFENLLATMKPKQRRDYEEFLRTPYEQRMEEGQRAAQKALDDFKNDPEVRRKVMRQARELMKRARTPKSK